MMTDIYDDAAFFKKYSEMNRSKLGLAGAGEWPTLQKLLPDFTGKTVLDLGCGYGWHCIYAAEHGAKAVTGVDLSAQMLQVARQKTTAANVTYQQADIAQVDFPENTFDVVLSSLAFHYLESFTEIAQAVHHYLKPNGKFIFSVEHPIFTAAGTQDWVYDANGKIKYFPVDRYFDEGQRTANFLGTPVTKYHHTLTTYIEGLVNNGFTLDHVQEPMPPQAMLELLGMRDELRRPMMLIIAATKR
ncbi:class I SAM-dependent methyltransferase [Loigolactobacillus zhaoyuanensis]|uniref:class I SAM-dependent methyltransferase n=1 Tax=Loigolactobacillus zhaoyuanensis TaxID=2486017 RepID=UPI00177F5D83|nr:class I SAM-dependent methyltransferase [Loigolactobacillus zhaoyuanensis]